MFADGLRTEATAAWRGATTARVEDRLQVQEAADEIFFDLWIAPVNTSHPQECVRVRNHFVTGVEKISFSALVRGPE